MGLTKSDHANIGSLMSAFSLMSTEGRLWTNRDLGELPTLMVVMCNHCPYVQAVDDRINNLAKDYRGRLQVFGINANDPVAYPEDNFEAMIERYKLKGYQFPYLWDESQAFVRSLGAVCTPDFFLFNEVHQLAYRGRLDDSWKDPQQVKSQDLREAIEAILNHRPVSIDQKSSLGCSIKWRSL